MLPQKLSCSEGNSQHSELKAWPLMPATYAFGPEFAAVRPKRFSLGV